ncbi:hypothetical protein ACFQHO_26645 [Actinomadura yumaensis]|uniref:hypothetical protein n=1 Tax=Actinomadura yumaensis TaxID=111807 RepID=UPI003612BEF0
MGAFAVLAVGAYLLHSWRVALIGLLGWCLYEFLLVPTICRVMTRQGFSCREPVRGRLFACTSRHQQVKNDGLWRLVGMRNPFRDRSAQRPTAPAPTPTGAAMSDAPGTPPQRSPDGRAASGRANERDTGVVVFSPAVRGRLAQADRVLILLAAAGTVVTIVGMVYGFG